MDETVPVKNKMFKDPTKEVVDLVQNIPTTPTNIVLGNIIEKKYDITQYEIKLHKSVLSQSMRKGFPEVFTSNPMGSNSTQSLFWQSISKDKPVTGVTNTASHNIPLTVSESVSSVLVEGIWSNEIHNENVQKLKQMSQDEILKEKNRLEGTLNPELIQFLKSRKKEKNAATENTPRSSVSGNGQKINVKDNKMEIDYTESSSKMEVVENTIINKENNCDKEGNVDEDVAMTNVPEPSIDILKQAKEKGWVHMDFLEPEKMKWMTNMPSDKNNTPNLDEPYNARFNFDGVLLPYRDDNVTVEKGLHHHGEEPERPGYSLQELLQLSRSSAQQQRCTALTTIANILEKSRQGWYDKTLQPAPLVALSQRNILLLLRFSLDDSSVAVVTATLQALRAYLYSEADEICTDRFYGWNNYVEPVLTPPPTDVSDISTLKDHELAQIDTVAVALRTDIILRIRYILSDMYPSPVAVRHAMEILIRLARHSHITALNIASTPNLLDVIIQNFIPLSTDKLATNDTITTAYGVPIVSAVRLCRMLVCYGGNAVAQRLSTTNIIQSILSYISSDTGKHGIHLSIEGLRLWKILLLHKRATDSVLGAQLILMSQLQLMLSNHDIGSTSELANEYAVALINVASCHPSLKENISLLLMKWSTQLESISDMTWGLLKLIAQTLMTVNDISTLKTSWLQNSSIFYSLRSTSNLLSGYAMAVEREPSSLPNYGVLTEGGQLQPIVSKESCIPFLTTVLTFFYNEGLTSEIQTIISQTDFSRYLKELEGSHWSLETAWYTRHELLLLSIVAKSAVILVTKLDRPVLYTIWRNTIKLISSLPGDCSAHVKEMLNIALSNEKLTLEMILKEFSNLSLDVSNVHINIDKKYDVANVYERYIRYNGNWNETAMPKDWIYLPLVHIYTKCKNGSICTDEDKKHILAALSLELILPELSEQLSPSLRFTRLVLVYLCDTVYLETSVSLLLSKVISNLLHKHHKKLDFVTELPGLSSFTDLFTALCENFCSTSYGDHNFAMTLLVPIAQQHNVHYRKVLWSEHAGALRYIRLTTENLAIPLEEYLYPIEDDTLLLESYLIALVRGHVRKDQNPVLYRIAIHHSAMYLKDKSSLAIRMRKQVEKIQNKNLANALLNYIP